MGLDMYLFAVDKQSIGVQTECKVEPVRDSKPTELAYWRKHHDLHGLMEEIYRSKGGTEEQFNCIALPLTKSDIDMIMDRVKEDLLPETQGFFFGNNPPDDESNKNDLEVFKNALQHLSDDKVVFYYSWW